MYLPPNNQRTAPGLERQVVTLIALGDKYADICNETGVPVPTIKKIKRRNQIVIAQIQSQITKQQVKAAVRILEKSQRLLLRKLDKAEADAEELDRISFTELNAVTKEAHQQLRLEEGKPTSIAQTTPVPSLQANTKHLEALVGAIRDGDEVELQRIVFSREK